MLTIESLEFAYNTGNQFCFPNILCGQGEHWLVMGASGCGKTTLLHLIAGLIKPQKGSITINGTDINKLRVADADRFRGKEIGIVFQKHYFVESLTVAENIGLSRFLTHQTISDLELEDLLGQLKLTGKEKSKPSELSQGELQRLSIARAIINSPSLILADEPTSSLDDRHCTESISLLKREAERNNSILMVVTHDQRLRQYFKNIIDLSKAKQ